MWIYRNKSSNGGSQTGYFILPLPISVLFQFIQFFSYSSDFTVLFIWRPDQCTRRHKRSGQLCLCLISFLFFNSVFLWKWIPLLVLANMLINFVSPQTCLRPYLVVLLFVKQRDLFCSGKIHSFSHPH